MTVYTRSCFLMFPSMIGFMLDMDLRFVFSKHLKLPQKLAFLTHKDYNQGLEHQLQNWVLLSKWQHRVKQLGVDSRAEEPFGGVAGPDVGDHQSQGQDAPIRRHTHRGEGARLHGGLLRFRPWYLSSCSTLSVFHYAPPPSPFLFCATPMCQWHLH
jgi:hypothetical protein